MNIGYFGDGPWSHRALDKIVADGDLNVVFIVARNTNPDPVLRQHAAYLDVPFLTNPNVNDPEFIHLIRSFEADLHVSMSFDQILRSEIIRSSPKGFINCHAGALPFYRGRNVLNWALINGERRFGVTVHYIDEGIDTGDILVQRFEEITETDDYRTLLDKAVVLCAETLHEALVALHAGTAERVSQHTIHPVGHYCSRRRPGDEWIDWSWSSERIHNFVRALTTPGPGARTALNGKQLVILSSMRIPNAPDYIDRPGTVVGRNDRGIVVKTGDSSILIRQVSDESGAPPSGEVHVPAIALGSILGISPWLELETIQQRLAALESSLLKH